MRGFWLNFVMFTLAGIVAAAAITAVVLSTQATEDIEEPQAQLTQYGDR